MSWSSRAKARFVGALPTLARGLRRLGAFALLALFMLATLASGRAYMWCAAMQQSVHQCCCDAGDEAEGAVAKEHARAQSSVRAACCASRATGDLPATQTAPSAIEVPAALAAEPIAAEPVFEAPRFEVRRFKARAPATLRHGPTRAGPRSAAGRCVELQVFRC